MRIDPIDFVFEFLNSLADLPAGSIIGDLTERETGDTSVYLEHSGGFRAIRDRMDRADIEYDVYHLDRKAAKDLAMLVREKLLEVLPGRAVSRAEVLDVEDISMPRYFPDSTSREHVYGGEVTVFFTEA